ncbi:hypothetical protein EVAR_48327_1 [Eumeta japonica]|uniref:Uncharacterized protein n=1 Tax=Eumeta variegata TaxID=151549 RepID=A0A4C1YQM8_EUMVA|nr:hypothetical protein EVAR_48327_1 [Eumeta japonica]
MQACRVGLVSPALHARSYHPPAITTAVIECNRITYDFELMKNILESFEEVEKKEKSPKKDKKQQWYIDIKIDRKKEKMSDLRATFVRALKWRAESTFNRRLHRYHGNGGDGRQLCPLDRRRVGLGSGLKGDTIMLSRPAGGARHSLITTRFKFFASTAPRRVYNECSNRIVDELSPPF